MARLKGGEEATPLTPATDPQRLSGWVADRMIREAILGGACFGFGSVQALIREEREEERQEGFHCAKNAQ